MKSKAAFAAALLVVLILFAALAGPAAAAEEELYRGSAEVNLMMTKLGRGTANLLTGWLEIPKQMAVSIRKHDPVSGTFIGVFTGIGWTWARTFTGAYEIVTFPFPTPPDYVPIIFPEYIVTSIWGEPIPIVSDPHNNWAEPRVPDYGTGEPVRNIQP